MIEYGDELVQIVEIDQPFCTRTYGVSPCTAALGTTGTRKCYNSRATCQDPTNYVAGTLTLRLSRPQEGLEQYGPIIPSIDSIEITPLKINIGAMDRGLSAFGQREVVSIQLSDHQHSDLLVDKYRLERPAGTAGDIYDPYERGTFWGKWIARNPYSEGYATRIYDGVRGQALPEMQVRHYLIDKIAGPNDGTATITAKDLFTKVEGRKAKAPRASKGELSAAITAAATSATLAPPGIGDLNYPASGYVAIGDEAMAFTRSGNTLTFTTRGALNTVADDHADEDKVQVILVYSGQSVHTIVNDLLVNYAGVPSSNIPLTTWAAEVAANLTNLYTAYIPEPTDVSKLIGELAEQAGFSIWPDVQTNLINLKAIVPSGSPSTIVDDNAWIVDNSLSIKPAPELRVSQVWHYFGQVNPLKKLDETTNYRSRVIVADLPSEDTTQYGTASVKEIFSRWIPQYGRASATQTGERILSIFRDPPFRAAFKLYASRDGQLSLATPFGLETDEVQDDTGAPLLTTHVPIKLIRIEDEVRAESQLLKFFTLPATAREIFIDNDTLDVNLRTAHDQLYAAPVSGDMVRVYINAVVGSSGTTAAFDVGSWPTGVDIEIYIYVGAYVSGRGGAGGKGRRFANGNPGSAGGLSFKTTYPVKVYNGGVIQGGGGGGGGGAAGAISVPGAVAGGGGGGGAGYVGGAAGGTDGNYSGGTQPGPGTAGTTTTAGTGGAGGSDGGAFGGVGGNGGSPGQAGSNGGNGNNPSYTGGVGGAAGAAINGISNISWIDVNGDPTANQGTILGATS